MKFILLNSSQKHIINKEIDTKNIIDTKEPITILNNEEMGLQLLAKSSKKFISIVGKTMDLSWQGLIPKIRIEIDNPFVQIKIAKYIKDDDQNLVADMLLDNLSTDSTEGQQIFYITFKFPKNFDSNLIPVNIKIFYSQGYEEEGLIYSQELTLNPVNINIEDLNSKEIYTDLWQHPSNWARAYQVPYYSPQHFNIIDNYMEGMSKIGQKVANLIISDFPWAGQRCYKVEENSQNLFELNIIKVEKNKNNQLLCDFEALDKYLELASKHHMDQEINLFGILGNWDAYDFGNPLKDFKDPIRISYYDQNTNTFKYLQTKEEIIEYLRLVFAHLKEKGVWKKILIMSDEPDNVEIFQKSIEMFKEALGTDEINIKCAVHNQEFFENYGDNIKSLSLNTCELINNKEKIAKIKKQIQEKGGTFTWYSCCFPTQLNIYLKSPLIESRIKGWFTYYTGMDGFLRWAYGIWPGNVMTDGSYKKEKWSAGDMFLVYPSPNQRPLESIRLKNFIYGLQDYLLLKKGEKILGKQETIDMLKPLIGEMAEMKFIPEREVELQYSIAHHDYINMREKIIMEIQNKKISQLNCISQTIVNMDEDNIILEIQKAIEIGCSLEQIYSDGMNRAMVEVTRLFENKEYFISEVIVCADTLNKGINYLKTLGIKNNKKGPKVLLAVVEGDLHEIGKNIVKIMFEAANFQVIDLGLNVSVEEIVKIAKEETPDVIGLSTMMTTTMVNMQKVVEGISKSQMSKIPKIIIGGGCINQKYAYQIRADGYSQNAVEAVKLVNELVGDR